jgi:hypothetical protein
VVQAIFDWVDWVGLSIVLLIIVTGFLWVWHRDRNGNDAGEDD